MTVAFGLVPVGSSFSFVGSSVVWNKDSDFTITAANGWACSMIARQFSPMDLVTVSDELYQEIKANLLDVLEQDADFN